MNEWEAKVRRVEETAQAILDARALYPDRSLAWLYDEITMPPELRAAHEANDRAVMDLYGFSPDMTEAEIVSALFAMYRSLTEEEGGADRGRKIWYVCDPDRKPGCAKTNCFERGGPCGATNDVRCALRDLFGQPVKIIEKGDQNGKDDRQ